MSTSNIAEDLYRRYRQLAGMLYMDKLSLSDKAKAAEGIPYLKPVLAKVLELLVRKAAVLIPLLHNYKYSLTLDIVDYPRIFAVLRFYSFPVLAEIYATTARGEELVIQRSPGINIHFTAFLRARGVRYKPILYALPSTISLDIEFNPQTFVRDILRTLRETVEESLRELKRIPREELEKVRTVLPLLYGLVKKRVTHFLDIYRAITEGEKLVEIV